MDSLLKHTLKRQMPYLIGGTITGTLMAYYYGFLFSIIVNSIIWFAISTIVNKYYWHYTGFKDEMRLISKYLLHEKDMSIKSNHLNDPSKMNTKLNLSTNDNAGRSVSKVLEENNPDNTGSPIK